MMIILTIVFLVLDIVSKVIVSNLMVVNDSILVIKNFFYITYVRNTGAAWSILAGNRFLLISIAIIALFLIFIFFIRDNKLSKLEIIFYSLLISGIVGNLIDRIIY